MKKKITKKASRRAVSRKATVKRSIHGPGHNCDQCMEKYGGMWGKDRSMMLLLAAGTIILAVVGMYMAGWI